MNLVNEKQSCNNAYYFEICILRLLNQMGCISEKELDDISQIAAEDYGATLLFNLFDLS